MREQKDTQVLLGQRHGEAPLKVNEENNSSKGLGLGQLSQNPTVDTCGPRRRNCKLGGTSCLRDLQDVLQMGAPFEK